MSPAEPTGPDSASTAARRPSRPDLVTKQRAGALLLDGDQLVLFARDKPGLPRYWATPGGSVDPSDDTVLAALYRELDEELRAEVSPALPVTMFDALRPDGRWCRHHMFVCRLRSMDFANRYGPEFSKPEKGDYEVVRVALNREALAAIDLQPRQLADYLRAHLEHVIRMAGRASYDYGIYFESGAPAQVIADLLHTEYGVPHVRVGSAPEPGSPVPAWINPYALDRPFGCELSAGDEFYRLVGVGELALATRLCRMAGTRALVSDESPAGSSWFLVARDGSYGRVVINDEDDDPQAGQVRYAREPITGEPDLPVVAPS